MGFVATQPELLSENPFKLIGSDWMLITTGVPSSFNTMAAGWGEPGVLWERNVAFCFIRPTRHTYQFVEQSERYTLSFFAQQHRKTLTFRCSHSGRDADNKGNRPLSVSDGEFLYFAEARLVLACRKLSFQDLNTNRFLDPSIEPLYAKKDYHRMYGGEIEKCLLSES